MDDRWLAEWRSRCGIRDTRGYWASLNKETRIAAAEWDALRFNARTIYGDDQLSRIKLTVERYTDRRYEIVR